MPNDTNEWTCPSCDMVWTWPFCGACGRAANPALSADAQVKAISGWMGNVNGPGCDPDVGPDDPNANTPSPELGANRVHYTCAPTAEDALDGGWAWTEEEALEQAEPQDRLLFVVTATARAIHATSATETPDDCPCRDTVPVEVTISADLSHTGETRRATKPLDKCIAEVVLALNRAGVATRGSCCGHGKDGEILLECGWTLSIPSPARPEKRRSECGCEDCALAGLQAASEAAEEQDRKTRPDEVYREFLRQPHEDAEKLKRQVADMRERERVNRCLEGLDGELLRLEGEDE